MKKVLRFVALAALLQGNALFAIGADRRAEPSFKEMLSSVFRKYVRCPCLRTTRFQVEKSGKEVVGVWIFDGNDRPAPDDRTSFSYEGNSKALEGFYPDESLKHPGTRTGVLVHVGKRLLSRYGSLEALISHLWQRTPSHEKSE